MKIIINYMLIKDIKKYNTQAKRTGARRALRPARGARAWAEPVHPE